MRTRNREVNIFNMSLLDILTGMLGAFLFLMLGLVPYYMKVSTQQAQPSPSSQGVKSVGNIVILSVAAQWNSSAKFNFFLYGPSNNTSNLPAGDVWLGPNDPLLPPGEPKLHGGDVGFGYATNFAVANANDHFFVICELLPSNNSTAVDPATYSHLNITVDLTTVLPGADPKFAFNFASAMTCWQANASQAKPGVLYGLFSVTVTQDKNNYNFKTDYFPNKFPLPSNVVPLPGIGDPFPPKPNNHPLVGVGLDVSSDAAGPQASASDLVLDHLVVTKVVPGGPGDKAGVQVGDEITRINGTNVAGVKFADVVEDWLRGKEGSPVQITVVRKGEASPLPFTLIRAKIPGEADQ